MHARLPLLSLLPAVSLAASTARVVNSCGFSAYLWSVSPSAVGPEQHLAAGGGAYSEAYRGSGIVLKITLDSSESSLYNASVPITQFQYTLDGGTVYYALADTRGDPFAGHPVTLDPSDASCTGVDWADGSGASTVYACESKTDLTLTLC